MTDTFFGPGTVDNVKCHVNALESKVEDLISGCNLVNSVISPCIMELLAADQVDVGHHHFVGRKG